MLAHSFPTRRSSDLTVHLFEAAIDLLSYATYLKCEGKDYKSESLLSLSGVYQPKKEMKDSKIPIALTTFLSANSQIKTIVLHLDNDKVGRLCTATLKELLQKDYKIVDDPPPARTSTIFCCPIWKLQDLCPSVKGVMPVDCVVDSHQKDTETKSKFSAESEE